jgi:AraC-like DNA-binding protein
MTEVVFPAGPNAYSLPAWETIFQAKKIGLSQVYDNELAKGKNFFGTITPGAEVALINAHLKQDIHVIKLPYPDPDFFDVVIGAIPEFKQLEPSSSRKLGLNSPHGAYFSNEKVKSEYELKANTSILWVIIRIRRAVVRGFVQEEGDELDQLLKSDEPFMVYKYISTEMRQILERLRTLEDDAYPEIVLRVKTGELLAIFFAEFLNLEKQKKHHEINPVDLERIIRVKKRLLSDLRNRPTISELSKEIGMSPTKLKSLFRKVHGTSIMQHFQEHRLQYAKKLLDSTPQRVSDVAHEIGYSNLSHFSEAFKKRFGILPYKYKEQRKKLDGDA